MSNTEQQRRGGLTRSPDVVIEPQPWGQLEWMVSGAIGNSDVLTVGTCRIDPGQQNPVHYHPNSDEVLHVVTGTIEHRVGDEHVPMSAGDTISIPMGMLHNARNVGTEQAVFTIIFDTAHREVIGE